MKYLTAREFRRRVAMSRSRYWKTGLYRWEYMSYAIEELQRIGAESIIEAGASGMPLCANSYLMDWPKHDLNRTPFMRRAPYPVGAMRPIRNREFDAFAALQVWEHLDRPEQAFAEVMRCAGAAVLSFPYMWPRGKGHDARHVGIDDAKISRWTLGIAPERKRLIHQRMVVTWRFV